MSDANYTDPDSPQEAGFHNFDFFCKPLSGMLWQCPFCAQKTIPWKPSASKSEKNPGKILFTWTCPNPDCWRPMSRPKKNKPHEEIRQLFHLTACPWVKFGGYKMGIQSNFEEAVSACKLEEDDYQFRLTDDQLAYFKTLPEAKQKIYFRFANRLAGEALYGTPANNKRGRDALAPAVTQQVPYQVEFSMDAMNAKLEAMVEQRMAALAQKQQPQKKQKYQKEEEEEEEESQASGYDEDSLAALFQEIPQEPVTPTKDISVPDVSKHSAADKLARVRELKKGAMLSQKRNK